MTMRRVASTACWRAESRAQRPVRASVAAMSRTCARSADVLKDRSSRAVLITVYCTLWHGLVQSVTRPQGVRQADEPLILRAFLVSFCQEGVFGFCQEGALVSFCQKRFRTLRSSPRKRGPRAKHSMPSKSGPPLPRGRTENVAPPVCEYLTVEQPVGVMAKEYRRDRYGAQHPM